MDDPPVPEPDNESEDNSDNSDDDNNDDNNEDDNDDDNEEDAMEVVDVVEVLPASEEEDESTEDEATDSEPEAPPPPSVLPPKMRIKLKIPKLMAGGSSNNKTTVLDVSSSSAVVRMPPPPTMTTTAAPGPDVTSVAAIAGHKKQRVLPSLPLASPPKRPPKLLGNHNSSAHGSTSRSAGANPKPKSRIRSLKLPLSQKAAPVVDDDEADEDDNHTGSAGRHAYSKRRSLHPAKPVKLPPLVSPGLLLEWQPPQGPAAPPGHNHHAGDDRTTPATLFASSLRAAGYTLATRKAQPHRGSSVRRVVGDMFDSNVTLTMHFPSLVPADMDFTKRSEGTAGNKRDADGDVVMDVEDQPPSNSSGDDGNIKKNEEEKQVTAADLVAELRHSLRPNGPQPPQTFTDLCPVSLTVPLPDTYLEERLNYVKLVEAREAAIVAHQEGLLEGDGTPFEKHSIPPIPELSPAPPLPASIWHYAGMADQYPLYPPKQADLVAHLDPNAFHLTEGRYFGLTSNHVKDPNFVGPNAPGSTSVSGLATSSNTSSVSSTPLTLSSVLFSNAPLVPPPASTSTPSTARTTPRPREGEADTTRPNSPVVVNESNKGRDKKEDDDKGSSGADGSWLNAPGTVVASTSGQAMQEDNDTPTAGQEKAASAPTASANALRKLMDESTPTDREELRRSIMRAAVATSQRGGQNQSWVGPNGLVYDIGKAFTAHAGMKPCERCKSNKQGSYHCRLRRKHQELDYDGGDSSATILRELEEAALLPFLKDRNSID
jgi:hypothetical protein